MRINCLSFLALLVLSICQFVIESSGENSIKNVKNKMWQLESEKMENENASPQIDDRRNMDQTNQETRDKTGSETEQSKNTQLATSESTSGLISSTSAPHSYLPTNSTSPNGKDINQRTSLLHSLTTLKTQNTEKRPEEYKTTNKDEIYKEPITKHDSPASRNDIVNKHLKANTKDNQSTKANNRSKGTQVNDAKEKHFKTIKNEKETSNPSKVTGLDNKTPPKSNYNKNITSNKYKTSAPQTFDAMGGSVKPTMAGILRRKWNTPSSQPDRNYENSPDKREPMLSNLSIKVTDAATQQNKNNDLQSTTTSDEEAKTELNYNVTKIIPKSTEIISNETEIIFQNVTSKGDSSQENAGSFSQIFTNLDKESDKFNEILNETHTNLSLNDTRDISDNVSNDKEQKEDDIIVDAVGMNNDKGVSKDNAAAAPSCTNCLKNGLREEDVQRLRKEKFHETIRKKLRSSVISPAESGYQADGATALPQLPLPIIEETIRDNLEEMEKDQFYAKDEEVIIPGENMIGGCIKANSTGCFSFNLLNIKYEISEAQLWVYKSMDLHDKKNQSIRVFDGRSVEHNQIIATNNTSKLEGWITLDVTEAALGWMKSGMDKAEVAIQCATCKGKNFATLFQVENYKPMLLLKYKPGNNAVRDKRSVNCDPTVECCQRDLDVNFSDIDMFEVFEPRNLSIGYCYGDCNLITQATYNHTSLTQNLRTGTYADQPTMAEQLKPCCVPLVLKDAFIMVIENGHYIRKIVPKVIVETCGCV